MTSRISRWIHYFSNLQIYKLYITSAVFLDKLRPYRIDLLSECLILVIAETITGLVVFKTDKFFAISVSCELCIIFSLFFGWCCMFYWYIKQLRRTGQILNYNHYKSYFGSGIAFHLLLNLVIIRIWLNVSSILNLSM